MSYSNRDKEDIDLIKKAIINTCYHTLVSTFVFKHGVYFNKVVKHNSYMELGKCFKNAYSYCTENEGTIRYVEGYAYNRLTKNFHLHAWNIDKANNVIDKTWKDGFFYFGVIISTNDLKTMRDNELCRAFIAGKSEYVTSILENYQNHYPYITKMNEKWYRIWEWHIGRFIKKKIS